MTRPKRLLCLTQYDESVASSRVRVYQFVPHLRKSGFEVTVRPLLSGDAQRLLQRLATSRAPWQLGGVALRLVFAFLHRTVDVLLARRYDVVLVQKDVLPFGLLRLLKAMGRPIIYDFDDPIWLGHPASGERFVVGRWVRDYRCRCLFAMLRSVSLVLTDNEELAKVAAKEGVTAEVLCSPVRADDYRYHDPSRHVPEEAILGWIGSPSTSYLLEELLPSLESLAALRRFRLLNVGGLPIQSSLFPIENLRWAPDGERAALRRMHVGLMPTDDRPFNRFRFGYKVVLYFCSGVPTLAADVALNRWMIDDGRTGILYRPADANDFAEKANALIEDFGLRGAIARRARSEAEEKYDVTRLAPRFIEVVDRALAGKNPKGAQAALRSSADVAVEAKRRIVR